MFVTTVALLSLGANPLRAGDVESYWNNPVGGDFDDPANWDGPVPDETVTAIFQLDASAVVIFHFVRLRRSTPVSPHTYHRRHPRPGHFGRNAVEREESKQIRV